MPVYQYNQKNVIRYKDTSNICGYIKSLGNNLPIWLLGYINNQVKQE